jgi:ADP-heptose:LPS heptosyltransferase
VNNLKKILLIQLYSNGDCLFATTVARQIKVEYPGCHLTWAIAGFCKSIIDNNPDVDEVMEVNSVPKNAVAAFRRFKNEMLQKKAKGEFDEVFITHPMDTNQALYDGIIRSQILNAYPHPITVPIQPVLRLRPAEIEKVSAFAAKHMLSNYTQVVLFEFAPQSGQSKKLNLQFALDIANALTREEKVAVILSSANKLPHISDNIIDGSELSIRETAALTHHCTMMIGCSSGLSWLTTSTAAKQLPMIQLLNAYTTWVNPLSRDFARYGLSTDSLIELVDFSKESVAACTTLAFKDFVLARKEYNQPIPLHFRTTRKIVYNLLCYLEFAAIGTHIKVNRRVYGDNMQFYNQVVMGFITAPFKLVRNVITKRLSTH